MVDTCAWVDTEKNGTIFHQASGIQDYFLDEKIQFIVIVELSHSQLNRRSFHKLLYISTSRRGLGGQMDQIILQILNGLDKGSAYALIALGLTLIFGTLGVVNFAHGALFMLGAFCAVTLSRILTISHTVIDETKKDFLGGRPCC